MCGIGGFFNINAGCFGQTADAMQSALAARGPDASHICYFSDDGNSSNTPSRHALLHTRLSIIDPRPLADQPMSSPNKRYWLCYNGEVYGWGKEARLLASERPFLTRSDTEFILRGAEAWGVENLLKKLTGMFAFALVDWEKRELILARDRFGEKPLLWWSDDRSFAFSSTLRGLLPALPKEKRILSKNGLDAYLAHRYIPAPSSVIAEVRRLPAGHLLHWPIDGGSVRINRWYHPDHDPIETFPSWLAAFDAAILKRCVADRPVGLFLSGGADSSVVACRLAQLEQNFQAFTASFPDSPFDEAPSAASLSNRLGLPHQTIEIPSSIRNDFSSIVAALDEPFADPSAVPMWYLSRETTKYVKVVLGGDGGDELLAGYKRYKKHLRSRLHGSFSFPMRRIPALAHPGKWQKLREEISMTWEQAYSLRFSGMSLTQRRFLQPEMSLLLNHWTPTLPDSFSTTVPTDLERLLAIDIENYLPEYILRKGDLTTMAHGLELRTPFLDHHFVKAISDLPFSVRFTEPRKMLLASALPDNVVNRTLKAKKRGFNPPLTQWLNIDLAERYDHIGKRLEDSTQGQLSASGVDAFVALYRNGHKQLAENVLQLLILDESLNQLKNHGLQ